MYERLPIIRKFEHMVSINSAIQIDLTGQVCAESIGTRLYSGVGGQIDFMRGAALSEWGRPVIALPATVHVPKGVTESTELLLSMPTIDGMLSRIVPMLTPGSAVTTSRAHVHYVITEYGVAQLHGRSLAERARSLIEVAAPSFREPLERIAFAMHLLR